MNDLISVWLAILGKGLQNTVYKSVNTRVEEIPEENKGSAGNLEKLFILFHKLVQIHK